MLEMKAQNPNKGKTVKMKVKIPEIKIPKIEEFVEYVNNHLAQTGEKPSMFGRRVLGDSGAITRLQNEKTDLRLSTMRKIFNAINGEEK